MGVLRLILAISVVLAHAGSLFGFSLIGGQLAVQAFYIISGFYMSLILNEKYIKKNSYWLFISNRLLRLYPIYGIILILTVTLCFFQKFTHNEQYSSLHNYFVYGSNLNFLSYVYLFFTNIFLFLQDMVMFLGVNIANGHLFFTSDFTQTNPPV